MRTLPVFAIILLGLVMPSVSSAQTILYEQAPDPTLEGAASNSTGQIVADQFEIPLGSTVAAVRWYGLFRAGEPVSGTTWTFRIQFYDGSNRLPESDPALSQDVSAVFRDSGLRVLTGSSQGRIIYEFTAQLPSTYTVTARKTQWISIQNPGSRSLGDWLWTWGPEDGRDYIVSRGTTNDWSIADVGRGKTAFALTGAVTIPCTEANPIIQLTTNGGGQNSTVDSTMRETFIGHITDFTFSPLPVCTNTILEYEVSSTVGEPQCTLDGVPIPPSGSFLVMDSEMSFICTNKPVGADTDRLRISPVLD